MMATELKIVFALHRFCWIIFQRNATRIRTVAPDSLCLPGSLARRQAKHTSEIEFPTAQCQLFLQLDNFIIQNKPQIAFCARFSHATTRLANGKGRRTSPRLCVGTRRHA